MTPISWAGTKLMRKPCVGLRGIVRISHTTLNGRSFLNLDGFAPASEWEELSSSVGSTREVARDL